MPDPFLLVCPHCQASGMVSDTNLLGREIRCSVCQSVFVATASPVRSAPAQPTVPLVDVAPQVNVAPVAMPAPAVSPAIDLNTDVPAPVSRGVSPGNSGVMPPGPRKANWLLISLSSIVSASVMFAAYSYFTAPQKRGAQSAKKSRSGRQDSSQGSDSIASAAKLAEMEKALEAANQKPVASAPHVPSPSVAPSSVASAIPATPDSPPKGTAKPEMTRPDVPKPSTAVTAAPTPAKVTQTPSSPQPTNEEFRKFLSTLPREEEILIRDASDAPSVPALLKLLDHPHYGVRYRVCEKLEKLAPAASAVAPLIKVLNDPIHEIRSAAASALKTQGRDNPEVIPPLVKTFLDNTDYGIEFGLNASIRLLSRDSPPLARVTVENLMGSLETAEDAKLNGILSILSEMGEAAKPTVPKLLVLLEKHPAKPEILGVLAQCGQLEPLGAIIKEKGSTNRTAKERIASGIGKSRPMTVGALEILKTLYQDTEADVRTAAIWALYAAEPKLIEAVPLLEQAQKDAEMPVREAATSAIAKYSVDPVAKLKSMLQSIIAAPADSNERSSIHYTIRSTKADGFRALISLLSDPQNSPELREEAAVSLIDFSYDESVDPTRENEIKSLMNNAEQPQTVRGACAIALKNIEKSDPQFLPVLLQTIADNKARPEVREKAVYTLPKDDPAMIPVLLSAAEWCETALPEDPSKVLRDHIEALHRAVLNVLCHPESAKPDPEKVLPRLITAINKNGVAVKIQALRQFYRYGKGSTEAADAARGALKNESLWIREAAAVALGQLGDVAVPAIPDLQSALKDEDSTVRGGAASALGELGPKATAAVPDLITALADDKKRVDYSARALAKIAPQDPAVLAALLKALEARHSRDDAIFAMNLLGPGAREAVPTLRKILADSEASQRCSILAVFGVLESEAKEAIPEILGQFADADVSVRRAAATALGKLGAAGSVGVPNLIKLLSDENDDVKSSALAALKRLGPAAKSALPELEKSAEATKNESFKQQILDTVNVIRTGVGDAPSKGNP